MKIKQQDYIGLAFTKKDDTFRRKVELSMLSDIGAGVREALTIDPSYKPDMMAMMHLRKIFTQRICSPKGWDHYLLTSKAMEIAERITVEKNFNYKLLSTLRAQQSCYLLGKDEFFRFIVQPYDTPDELAIINGGITIMHMKADHGNEVVNRTSFFISYERGVLSTERLSDLHWVLAQRLLRLIIFVEMSEPELLVVEAHTDSKNRKAPLEQRIENKTDVRITRVHSDWNKFVVCTSEIAVKGFLRLQPCGPQWSQRKLTWVKPHARNGYKRPNRGPKALAQ